MLMLALYLLGRDLPHVGYVQAGALGEGLPSIATLPPSSSGRRDKVPGLSVRPLDA